MQTGFAMLEVGPSKHNWPINRPIGPQSTFRDKNFYNLQQNNFFCRTFDSLLSYVPTAVDFASRMHAV